MSHSHTQSTVTCLNCGHTYEGQYCNRCGQKADTHRFSVGHVLHELPHLLHLERGIFKNIRSMLRPRQTVQEYLSGRRIGYFNPLLYFFLSLGLILFAEKTLDRQAQILMNFELDIGIIETPQYDAGPFINKYLRLLYFALAFIVALPNYFLFRKASGYNYAEQVLAAAFILGFMNTVYLVLFWMPLGGWYFVNIYCLVLYLLFTGLVFYRGRWWLTLLKTGVSVVLSVLLFVIVLISLWAIRLTVQQQLGV